jgi:hypothetical protein
MPIDQSSANFILETARNFYKGSEKSANKRYDTTGIPDPTVKHTRRNHLQRIALQNMVQYRERDETFSMSFLQLGQDLFSHGNRAGNCLEMSSVAAYLTSAMLPGQCQLLLFGRLSRPGDHLFLLLSVNGNIPSGLSISGLTVNTMDDQYWVIDPWANIACRVAEYPARLLTKLTQWSGQQKQVAWQRAWRSPSNPEYVAATLNSPLTWESAYNLAMRP